ncbi:MAG TPA: hypothetical protein VFJ13_09680 [Paracoccaceae bacterium]|nr:hypothetical protein [Paracoccaceae bacterium]
MAVSGIESRWLGAHLGDAEAAALFADEAEIGAMVRVEAALARVQGRLELIPAEAAQFALAAHMPRPEAQSLVKAAIAGHGPDETLIGALRRQTEAPVDWGELADPARHTGAAAELVDRVLAAV